MREGPSTCQGFRSLRVFRGRGLGCIRFTQPGGRYKLFELWPASALIKGSSAGRDTVGREVRPEEYSYSTSEAKSSHLTVSVSQYFACVPCSCKFRSSTSAV